MKQRTTVKSEYLGSTVVGERGQVVIPKDIRDQMSLRPGTKLIVFHHDNGPIAFMPMNMVRMFLKDMTGKIKKI
jgi:AbrB family looped-hinge helix DNA binding protein